MEHAPLLEGHVLAIGALLRHATSVALRAADEAHVQQRDRAGKCVRAVGGNKSGRTFAAASSR
jgi:hypothetical protein